MTTPNPIDNPLETVDPWRRSVPSEEPPPILPVQIEHEEVAAKFVPLLLGLSAAVIVLGIATPTTAWVTALMSLSFMTRLCLVFTICLPALVTLTFAVVVPMFWYGAIQRRLIMVGVTILPGSCGILILAMLLTDNVIQVVLPISTCLIGHFLGASTVAILAQMTTPWTLSHSATNQVATPPFSLSNLIGITAVYALGCSVFAFPDAEDFVAPSIAMFASGSFAAFIVVRMLIRTTRQSVRTSWREPVALSVMTLLFSFVATLLAATEGEGWSIGTAEFFLLMPLALYGACTIWLPVFFWLAWVSYLRLAMR